MAFIGFISINQHLPFNAASKLQTVECLGENVWFHNHKKAALSNVIAADGRTWAPHSYCSLHMHPTEQQVKIIGGKLN